MSKRRNLTAKRLAAVWSETSGCYSAAAKEYGMSSMDLRDLYVDEMITEEEYLIRLEELDELYRAKLCKLSSETIEDVIRAHNKSIQKRAKKTLETLTTELLERQLKNEEDRSS